MEEGEGASGEGGRGWGTVGVLDGVDGGGLLRGCVGLVCEGGRTALVMGYFVFGCAY